MATYARFINLTNREIPFNKYNIAGVLVATSLKSREARNFELYEISPQMNQLVTSNFFERQIVQTEEEQPLPLPTGPVILCEQFSVSGLNYILDGNIINAVFEMGSWHSTNLTNPTGDFQPFVTSVDNKPLFDSTDPNRSRITVSLATASATLSAAIVGATSFRIWYWYTLEPPTQLRAHFIPGPVTPAFVDANFTHNKLGGVQGGISTENYHLTSDQHNKLTAALGIPANRVLFSSGDSITYDNNILYSPTSRTLTITGDARFGVNVLNPKADLHTHGATIVGAPNIMLQDAALSNNEVAISLDELNNQIAFKARKSDGNIIITTTGGSSGAGNGDIPMGDIDGGIAYSGLLSIQETDAVNFTINEVNKILSKLAPAKPENLSAKSIAMPVYSARAAGTGDLHTTCTDDTTPRGTVTEFYDGDIGILSAKIDDVEDGSITLSTASDVGSNGALTITADEDPYAGQTGKEGFWKQLSAYIESTTALAFGSHTYQMLHSITGDTAIYIFYVDNPTTVTVTNVSAIGTASGSKYISGVPTLENNDIITVSYDLNDAVKQHYNPTRLAVLTSIGGVTNTVSVPPVGPYTEDQVISLSTNTVVQNNRYTENVSYNIAGYNAKDVAGTVYNLVTNIRVDTISNESNRRKSGVGQFPLTYGDAFDSTESLKAPDNEELQLINGLYRYPYAVDYSSNLPVAGPNYASGLNAGTYNSMRWVTFNPMSIFNAAAITIVFNNASNFVNPVMTGFCLYIKVEGATGWLDGNAAYPGVGSPTIDGDAALVVGSSTATTKRITFGSVTRSGPVWIRIGLPAGSNKSFGSITVTAV